MFAMMNFAARKSCSALQTSPSRPATPLCPRRITRAKRGVRGETYACWYLRRHGYTLVARSFTSPGSKREIEMVG
jgi:hypothetical protein